MLIVVSIVVITNLASFSSAFEDIRVYPSVSLAFGVLLLLINVPVLFLTAHLFFLHLYLLSKGMTTRDYVLAQVEAPAVKERCALLDCLIINRKKLKEARERRQV